MSGSGCQTLGLRHGLRLLIMLPAQPAEHPSSSNGTNSHHQPDRGRRRTRLGPPRTVRSPVGPRRLYPTSTSPSMGHP